ncbi:MAG TPA: tetratricopeptide repeat protein, partial [Sphingomicrobium sp.]|nr:tetratricopeptide repeat protein [Sphingomicrobium sp.]
MSVEFDQAVEAFRKGDLEEARAFAEAEMSAAPSPDVQHLLGLIHCRLGDPASGVEYLIQAADAQPENAGFQIMLMRALIDIGRADEVLQMPEPPAIRSAAALELWRARAEAADAVTRTDVSIEAWSKIADAAPADWRAWANLGNAYATAQAWSEAAVALSKAAALNPGELTVQRNAGSAFLQLNQPENAIRHLTAVVGAQPKLVEDRILLARALAWAQRHDEAIGEFESARRLGGSTFEIEFGIGQSHSAKMRFVEAEAALERAYMLEPTNRAAVFNFGVVLD